MKIKIITIGEPKLSFAKEGFEEYVKRMKRFHNVEVIHLKDGVNDAKILANMKQSFCVALDESGKELSSKELSIYLDEKALQSIGQIAFLIGGPDGHSNKVMKQADFIWSFGKLTFPHDLAMLILAEALYRASTISVGHPYHRE
jgi:23S rRNA (pseudouridine1915-N3)-methyltransferase